MEKIIHIQGSISVYFDVFIVLMYASFVQKICFWMSFNWQISSFLFLLGNNNFAVFGIMYL